jgi:hypothetical protein
MNKIRKIAVIFILMIVFLGCVHVEASWWNNIEKQAGNFIKQGQNETVINVNSDKVVNAINSIGQVLTTIGLSVSLVVGLILGIKYMTASPDEAAKIKKQLVGLVISTGVLVGAFTIWSLAYSFMNSIT